MLISDECQLSMVGFMSSPKGDAYLDTDVVLGVYSLVINFN